MTTASDICTEILQDLGVVAIEETPTAAESQKVLTKLNSMVESWNTESTMIYNIEPLTLPLVGGKQTYTVGTGGDLNTSRPVRIVDITIRDSNGMDIVKCGLATEQEYAAQQFKSVQSAYPLMVYDDGNFPLKTLYMLPVPVSSAYSAIIWAWLPLSSALTLASVVNLPPGYKRALISNCCIEAAPAFGATVSQEIAAIAQSSKQDIERINLNVRQLGIDGSIPVRGTSNGLQTFYTGPYP